MRFLPSYETHIVALPTAQQYLPELSSCDAWADDMAQSKQYVGFDAVFCSCWGHCRIEGCHIQGSKEAVPNLNGCQMRVNTKGHTYMPKLLTIVQDGDESFYIRR